MPDELVLKLKLDASEVKGKLGGPIAGGVGRAAAGAGGGVGGIMGGIMSAITSPLGIIVVVLTAILGVLMFILNSSKMLMNVIKIISKLIQMIVRPIGDMLGMALMPLVFILKPVGTFVRTIMRPYYQAAMKLVRRGGQLYKMGEKGEAFKAWGVAAVTMLGGFGELFIRAGGELAKMIVSGFFDTITALGTIIFDILIAVFEPIGFGISDGLRKAKQGFIEGMTSIKEGVLNAIDEFTTTAAMGWRTAILGLAEDTLKATDDIVAAWERMRSVTGGGPTTIGGEAAPRWLEDQLAFAAAGSVMGDPLAFVPVAINMMKSQGGTTV